MLLRAVWGRSVCLGCGGVSQSLAAKFCCYLVLLLLVAGGGGGGGQWVGLPNKGPVVCGCAGEGGLLAPQRAVLGPML